jgi:hypothetical protein
MDRLVSSRWFALADLLIVLGCGAIWIAWPAIGGWPLLIALFPWAVRLAAGQFPFQRSSLDFPLLLFLLTAGVGVWAAYDHGLALAKFWVLISAVLVYFAIAGQPKANMGVLTGLFGLLGVFIAFYFLLTQDWSKSSSIDFGGLDRIGLWIMANRPDLTLNELPPNQAGGLLALLLPFSAAFLMNSWKNNRWRLVAIAIISVAGMLIGLLLTSSRGAWLALLAGMGIWLLWWLFKRFAGGDFRKAGIVFGIVLLGLGIMGLVGAVLYPGGVLGIVNKLPGLPDGESRLDLAQSALQLIADYPLTGGGLRSFPGLYSQYIMVTPFLLFEYSHNFLLDVALEQSIFGWLAIVLVYGISIFLLVKFIATCHLESELQIIAEATLVSIVVVVLHGLVDDALYSNAGTPLLFLLPGMAVGLSKFGKTVPTPNSKQQNFQKWLVLVGVTFVMIGLAIVIWRNPLLGIWQSNLGAISMAQSDLVNWPTGRWNGNPDISVYQSARQRFLHAVKIAPHNRTAHHRLGLIALQGRQYPEARDQLNEAYRIDSDHRGIRKTAGYANVWTGNFDQAALLLAEIPEAIYELGEYNIWWKRLDRFDLANQANQMEEILKGMTTPNLYQRENQP